ncbi:DUF2339 domain-containing protein [Actinokineospora sp. 24-640]
MSDSPLVRLAAEVEDLSRRLSHVGAELRTLRPDATGTPEHASPTHEQLGFPRQPIPEQPGFPERPTQEQQPFPRRPGSEQPRIPQPTSAQQPFSHQPFPQQQPFAPYQGFGPPMTGEPGPMPNAVPPPRRVTLGERLSQEGAGSKLLAWVGGAVTLLGVVLLLVLAIQRGWLGPLPRVLVGAAFGLGLIGTGLRLHRNPAARTGAFALAATGIAVLYLDTVAATALYDYLPVVVGLALGLAITVGGVLLATRWDSALLAAAVVIGCAVCAPVITSGFTPALVTFLLVVTLATTPIHLTRDWPIAALAARVPPVAASAVASVTLAEPGSWANTATAVATSVVGVVLALLTLRRTPAEPGALASLGVAVIPVMTAAVFLPTGQAVAITAGAAVALLAVWAMTKIGIAGIAGMVAALQATALVFDGAALAGALLAEGLLLAAVAGKTLDRTALYGGGGFAALGAIRALTEDIPPELLAEFRHAPRPGAALVAALLLAAAIAVPWAASRAGALPAPAQNLPPWLAMGAVALYGAAALVLSTTLLAIPGRTGFLTGHVLITVSWTAAALVLLAKGIRSVALRATGLALVTASVAKLILFDLAALDGIARVAAFIAAGLILLTAGTRYARVVATRERVNEVSPQS